MSKKQNKTKKTVYILALHSSWIRGSSIINVYTKEEDAISGLHKELEKYNDIKEHYEAIVYDYLNNQIRTHSYDDMEHTYKIHKHCIV